MRPSVNAQGSAAFGSGGVAVRGTSAGGSGPPKGDAAHKRAAVNRKRREEAELRVLWEQETDRSTILTARITETEKAMVALAKQLEVQLEEESLERSKTEQELLRWTRREEELALVVQSKKRKLKDLDDRVRKAEQRQNMRRLALVELFLRRDQAPDVELRPGEEDRWDEGDAATTEPAAAANTGRRMSSSRQFSLSRRGSASMKLDASMGFEDPSDRFISRDNRHQIAHDRQEATAAQSKSVREALDAAAAELNALEAEEQHARRSAARRTPASPMSPL